jgi:hypothetical protein
MDNIKNQFYKTLKSEISKVDKTESEKIISFADYLYQARFKQLFGEQVRAAQTQSLFGIRKTLLSSNLIAGENGGFTT